MRMLPDFPMKLYDGVAGRVGKGARPITLHQRTGHLCPGIEMGLRQLESASRGKFRLILSGLDQ
jgi:hypothetical protein